MNNNTPNMHFIHTQQQVFQPDFQSNQINFRDVSSTNSPMQQNNMQPSPVSFVPLVNVTPMVPPMVPLMIPQDSLPFMTPSFGRNMSTTSLGSLDGPLYKFSTPPGLNMSCPQFVFSPSQQQQLYVPQVSPQVRSVPASPNGSPIRRQQLCTPTRQRSKSVPGPIQVRDLQKQNSQPQAFLYPRTDSIPQFKNKVDPAPLVLEDYRSGSTVSMQYDFHGSENSCLTSQSRSLTRENLMPITQQDFSRSCSVDPSYSNYEEEVGDLLGELAVLSEAAEKSFRKLDDVVKRKYGDKECEESREIRKFQHAVIEESKYHNEQPKEQKDVFQDLCAEMCFTIMKEISSRNPKVADLASKCTHHFSFLRLDDMNPRDYDFFEKHDHGRASAIFISLLKMKQQFPRLREDRHSKESNMRGSNVVRMRNKRLGMFQNDSYEFWQRVKNWMNDSVDVQDMFVCRDYQKRTKANGKEIRTMQGLLLYIVFENNESSVRFCFECLKLFKQESKFDKLFRKENISSDCFHLLGKANWEPADFEKFQKVYHLGLALDKRSSRTPTHNEPTLRVMSLAKTAS